MDSTQSGVCILLLVEYGYYAYSYSTLVEYAYSISNMLVVRMCMDFRSIASENDVFAYVHLFSPQLVVTHVPDLVRNKLASSQSSHNLTTLFAFCIVFDYPDFAKGALLRPQPL